MNMPSQCEADLLLSMHKVRQDDTVYEWNDYKLEVPVISQNGREHFLINYTGARRIEITRGSCQSRYRSARLLIQMTDSRLFWISCAIFNVVELPIIKNDRLF